VLPVLVDSLSEILSFISDHLGSLVCIAGRQREIEAPEGSNPLKTPDAQQILARHQGFYFLILPLRSSRTGYCARALARQVVLLGTNLEGFDLDFYMFQRLLRRGRRKFERVIIGGLQVF
jgi:hypothetical protein